MRQSIGLSLAIAALSATAIAGFAAPAANADVLSGAWSGGGTVRLTSGQVEKVRCRVSYSKSTGKTYLINATCSSTGGTFAQTGRVVQLSGNRFRGRLYSDEYEVSGNISISVRGKRQTVSVSSAKGTGSLALSKR